MFRPLVPRILPTTSLRGYSLLFCLLQGPGASGDKGGGKGEGGTQPESASTEGYFGARHCPKHFAYTDSFNLPSNLLEISPIVSPILQPRKSRHRVVKSLVQIHQVQ